MKKVRKIGIFNNKGGVAKTTSVINLAYSLQKHNYKVLVVDCDTQENCFMFFMAGKTAPGILATDYQNIFHTTWERYTSVDAQELDAFDYILFDLPPTMSEEVKQIIRHCTVVYVPTILGEFEISGLKKVTDEINKQGVKLGGVFVTMYHAENDSEIIEEFRRVLQNRLMRTVIPYSKTVRESQKAGLPIEAYFRERNVPQTQTSWKIVNNLNAIVGDTLTDSIQMIDIDELHESEDNFFIVDRIEEFAQTILGQGGVKDNLIVRPLETGGYEIISGHRRKAAVQYLLDNGENISRYLPCLVQEYADDDTKLLDIVLMNISARQISDAELWKSYEIVDRILKEKKSAGEKFGRIREKLAECLGVSPSQVSKLQNVERNAVPAVKEAVKNGEMSISTANEIARLDEEKQEELVQQSDLSEIRHKDVKQMNADAKNSKVATCGNFPENDSDDETPEEKDTSSESDDEPEKEISIISTSAEDDKEIDTPVSAEDDSSNQEIILSDETPDSKSESEEKVATCGNSQENDDNVTDTLSRFIYDNYFTLETILTSYLGDDDEEEIIEQFQELLRKVKETERDKVRFGA